MLSWDDKQELFCAVPRFFASLALQVLPFDADLLPRPSRFTSCPINENKVSMRSMTGANNERKKRANNKAISVAFRWCVFCICSDGNFGDYDFIDDEGGRDMHTQRLLIGSALITLILTGCQHSLVRDKMPTVTRTGDVKDIIIKETVSPATVTVNPGDEIRWINHRQGDVRVIFLAPVTDSLTCQRNFRGGVAADRNEYAASLSTNDTASVCFRSPTELKYVVRAKSSEEPSGEQNIAGTITVASDALARPSIENATHTATSKEEEPTNLSRRQDLR